MSEQAITDMQAEGNNPPIGGEADDQKSGPGGAAGPVSNGFVEQHPDPSAPLGYKADGTPRKSRAGRPPSKSGAGLPVEDGAREDAAQKVARLSKVRAKPQSEQAPTEEEPSLATAVPARMGVDHVSLGTQAAYLFMITGALVLGQDFQPDMHPDGTFTMEGRTDFNAVRDSFANYFKATGIDKIDPGWGLAIGLIAYSAKRAQKPAVRTRIGKCVDWAKEKFAGGFSIFRRRST